MSSFAKWLHGIFFWYLPGFFIGLIITSEKTLQFLICGSFVMNGESFRNLVLMETAWDGHEEV